MLQRLSIWSLARSGDLTWSICAASRSTIKSAHLSSINSRRLISYKSFDHNPWSTTTISSSSFSTSSTKRAAVKEEDENNDALETAKAGFPRRSMLYVPGSSDKMIKKSQESQSDCIIFDLEDSVASHRKGAARESVLHGLNAAPRSSTELAVRINPPSGSIHLASDDLDIILPIRQLNVRAKSFSSLLMLEAPIDSTIISFSSSFLYSDTCLAKGGISQGRSIRLGKDSLSSHVN